MARGDDEHMNVPTWRMRQLQDIEHAAREVVELIDAARRVHGTATDPAWATITDETRDRLIEALGDG